MEVSPHTADDLEAMLAAVGATGLDALFDHIPAASVSTGRSSCPPA